MEAGFDNTNATSNPFVNTNGAEILSSHQKEGFLLDLDGFRSNTATHTNEFFTPSNGKGAFEEDDEDLGPETDVDALDDVQSPVKLVAGVMSDELEEKVAKEIDANLLKSVAENCNTDSNLEHDEDDEHDELIIGEQRKRETPTPPADEVHDAGLDSDSEEDEWNYIKGAKEEDKENVDPSEQSNPVEPEIERALTVDENEEIDNMSQLNPNAEEFVPVSPTRTMDQPMCATLKEEQILAQSPRRPNQNCDFNVPEEDEFEEGVKRRPSEFYSNGHENGHKQSSQEIMVNLLNGKNIDEIEFQSIASPTKVAITGTEHFIFGPNASASFSTPGKFMDQSRSSTNANYGDESGLDVSDNITTPANINPFADEDLLDRLNKEKDPMSMSFYQDKEDADTSTPFDDLNKVHDLSMDEEDVNKDDKDPSSFNDSISDLPEHNPLVHDIITTDLDKREDDLMGVCALPKSPIMENNTSELVEPVKISLHTEDFDLIVGAVPEIASAPGQEEPHPQGIFETDDEIVEHPQDPLVEVGAKSPMPDVITEELENEEEFESNAGHYILNEMHPEPVVCYASREAELFHHEAASEDVSASSDIIQQQEFIPETLHEVVAQSLEPVVTDFTPDHEMIGIVESIFKQEPLNMPVQTSELPLETPFIKESPVVESFQNQVVDLLDMETPVVVEPPLATMCGLTARPMEDLKPSLEEPEITTPVDEITSSVKDDSPVEEAKDIKHDLIDAQQSNILESPVQEVSPSSDVIQIDDIQPKEEADKPIDSNDSLLVETAVAVAAAVTTVTIGAGVIAEAETKQPEVAPKTKTTTATKKPAPTKNTTTGKPLASTKTSAAKTSSAKPASAAAPLSSRSMPTKTSTTKSTTGAATARAAAAKPRSGTAKPTADKKPLTNGDVKATPPKPAPIRRPQVPSTTKPAAPKTTTATAKPPASSTTIAPATRPAAASALKTAAFKPLSATAAPKPRPTTLSTSKTATTTKATLSARPLSSTTATTRTTSKTGTTTTKPKPTSAPISKPRIPLTNRTARAPDAEKQNKENVNKLTARRTAATRTSITRKVDGAKTTAATKTSSLANKTGTKKPLQKNTNSATATKSKEEKIVPNGVSAEKESSINEADLLLKDDLSPVNNLIIDNSQVSEATAD